MLEVRVYTVVKRVRDDLPWSSALLQFPFSQFPTADRNVGFSQMQVKSFTLLQFAFAALEYMQVCYGSESARLLNKALRSLQHRAEAQRC